jgi:predicted amidohydrolase YtcJ
MGGYTAETKDPKGGVFRRKEGSPEPNGVLEEYDFFCLVSKLAANFDNDINDALVEEGTRLVASFGYTTAQEGRAMGAGLEAMKRVADSGRLAIDLVAYPDVLEVDDVEPAALSSPAVFGLAMNYRHGSKHAMPGVKPVCGDGCFNHGLRVLMHALNNGHSSTSGEFLP